MKSAAMNALSSPGSSSHLKGLLPWADFLSPIFALAAGKAAWTMRLAIYMASIDPWKG